MTGRVKRVEVQKRALREQEKLRTPSQAAQRLFEQRQRAAINVENMAFASGVSNPMEMIAASKTGHHEAATVCETAPSNNEGSRKIEHVFSICECHWLANVLIVGHWMRMQSTADREVNE